MLDKFRETAITWDKANRKVYEPLRVSAGDNKGRKLSVQVVNGGVIESLSGASLSLFWETKDKAQKGLDAFTAVDATKGEFEIYYTTGMLSNEGTLNANLVLVDASGRVVSEPFTITVFKGIDDDAIQSSDSFTALTEALAQVSTINNKADRDELLALESTFEQNKVSVEQQLQQTTHELEVRSVNVDNYGADPTGQQDSYEAFFNALNAFPEQDVIRVFLPGRLYKLSKPLYYTRRVLFEGNGIDRTTLDFSQAEETSNHPYNSFLTVVHRSNIPGGSHDPQNPIILPPEQVGDYGQHSVLKDFSVRGRKNATDENNGIFINAPCELERVRFVDMNGHGQIIGANGDKDGLRVMGNANHTRLKQTYSYGCSKDGIHIFGADANTFYIDQVLTYHNDGWGIYDNSFLGGVVTGCEADGNALGAYTSTKNTGSRTVWVGNYVEGNQPVFYDVSSKHIILGATGMPPEAGQPYFGGLTIVGGGVTARVPLRIADSEQLAFEMGGATGYASELTNKKIRIRTAIAEPLVSIEQDGVSPNYAALRVDTTSSIALPYKDISNAIKKGTPLFRLGFALSQNVSYTLGNGSPTEGTWTGGQRIINQSPTSGSYEGWVCVNGGTPGTWKGYGLIS